MNLFISIVRMKFFNPLTANDNIYSANRLQTSVSQFFSFRAFSVPASLRQQMCAIECVCVYYNSAPHM